MSITYSITEGVRSDIGAGPISSSYSEVGTNEQTLDVTLPANTVNFAYTISLNAATLQVLCMIADQNMTILMNSTSAPSNTFNLKANIPFLWSVSPGYFPNPLTASVTGLYITSAQAGRLRARFLSP
jgi:hypothetical protein